MTLDELKSWCSRERETLKQPWSENGFSYASDGRILIRVATMSGVQPRPDAPKAEKLWPDFWKLQSEFIPLPGTLPEPEFEPCKDCNGQGRIRKCPECEGTGEAECPTCGHETECEYCDDGLLPVSDDSPICEDCGGSGKIEKIVAMEIFARNFNSVYLRGIAPLPGLKVAVNPSAGEECGILLFTFDGGEGCLMGMRV